MNSSNEAVNAVVKPTPCRHPSEKVQATGRSYKCSECGEKVYFATVYTAFLTGPELTRLREAQERLNSIEALKKVGIEVPGQPE